MCSPKKTLRLFRSLKPPLVNIYIRIAQFVYTTKYTVIILIDLFISAYSLQPSVQVLTREPHLQNVMNIFVDNGYH